MQGVVEVLALGAATVCIWVTLLVTTWHDMRSLREPYPTTGRESRNVGYDWSGGGWGEGSGGGA